MTAAEYVSRSHVAIDKMDDTTRAVAFFIMLSHLGFRAFLFLTVGMVACDVYALTRWGAVPIAVALWFTVGEAWSIYRRRAVVEWLESLVKPGGAP